MWTENPHIRQPLIKLAFLFEALVQGEKSIWKEYLNVLPNVDEINLPTAWTTEELNWLQGSNIYGHVPLRKQQWELEFEDLKAYVEDFDWDLFTLENYNWASSIFLSRAFPARVLYGNKFEADDLNLSLLIPVLDSLNHKPETPVYWTADSGSFSFSIGSNVEQGQEIFNNYGPKGTEELLMGYGFCIDSHLYDIVTLKLLLPPVDGIAEAVSKYGLELNEGYVVSHLTLSAPLNLKLLMLFTFLSRAEDQGIPSKNNEYYRVEQLKGVDSLMRALSQKLDNLNDGEVELTEEEFGQLGQLSKQRYNIASTYREGQSMILMESLEAGSQLQDELISEADLAINFEPILKDPIYTKIWHTMFESEDEDMFEDESNTEIAVMVSLALERLKGTSSPLEKDISKVWVSLSEDEFQHFSNVEEINELYEWCDPPSLADAVKDESISNLLQSSEFSPKLFAESKATISRYGYWDLKLQEEPALFALLK